MNASPEPEFVNLLRNLGIDSQPGGQVRQPYLMYQPAGLHRLAESIPWNRFLGSLNVYKFGLCTFCTKFLETEDPLVEDQIFNPPLKPALLPT